jgi:hypothetical protein
VTRTLTIGALFLALVAFPAAALAQSAGDDQYSDPLAPSEQPADQGQSAPAPQATAPAQGAPATSTEPATSAPTDAAAAAAAGRLPRTGLSMTLLLGTAMALLAGGLGLRHYAATSSTSTS